MKNILITGIRGFIGFNAVQLWKKEHPEYNYFGLDADTYADNIFKQEKDTWLDENKIPHITLYLSSTSASKILDRFVTEHVIDTVVHFAAESHVDNSIKNPDVFFQSNVIGTVAILNAAKKHDLRVHIIGTDEVYGETRPTDWFNNNIVEKGQIKPEDKPLVPSSPYSSSKASADMIALSYQHTFGTKVTVSRCSNNAGCWQHPEKLMGTVISKVLKNEKIPVYGAGLQKRHWIDVDDHNRAVMWILHKGESGKIYNIGPEHANWITNIDLIKFILKYLGKPETLIEHVTDRLGHDTSYYLYSSIPDFKTAKYTEFMPKIIDWYADKFRVNKIEQTN